ncbi:hypothetical protein K3495_g7536 [Podosphaera aphanis]|nr:hypothetical protein K3495_g7536 [Podosphaera aphanis]
MSDLVSGRPTAPINEEINRENLTHRPQGSSGSISGIKGPREVMRERNEREARRRVQLEQLEVLERERAIEEMQLLEESRKSAARRAAATAGAAAQLKTESSEQQNPNFASTPTQKKGGNNPPPGYDRAQSKRRTDRSQGDHSSTNGRERSPTVGEHTLADKIRSHPALPEQTRPNRSEATSTTPHPTARSSFPHAFERWETLSAHWEGLTSFWIRRLEENSNDINRDPLSQQLSRQVTDLSAAGANLFHAVVELQRLRASSERKFQRWFFETRSEQERNQEIQAAIERKLQAETSARAAAVASAAAFEREKTSSEKRLAEMKRELRISKEEARRAWEELGRREQEERARTLSLREGLPTVMGGVQVVPMIAGAMSRPGTTHEAKHADSPSPAYRIQTSNDDLTYQNYSRSPPNPNNPYPETSTARRTPVSRATGGNDPNTSQNPTSTNTNPNPNPNTHPQAQTQTNFPATKAFYQQDEGTSLEPTDIKVYGTSPASEASFSDENEEKYRISSQGHYVSDQPEPNSGFQAVEDCLSEMDVAMKSKDNEMSYSSYAPMSGVEYGKGSTAAAGYLHIPGIESAPNSELGGVDDLSGFSGYNLGTEWAGVPRHRHPTRLSDVMEEDERSRTSASQVSRT